MNNPIIDGFETKEVTLRISDGVAVGKAVGLTNNCTALRPAAGAHFCGVCNEVRGKYASVVMRGHAKTMFTGTAPIVGYNKLAADGTGYVKVDDTNGRLILVTAVDAENNTIEFLL